VLFILSISVLATSSSILYTFWQMIYAEKGSLKNSRNQNDDENLLIKYLFCFSFSSF